MDSSTPQPQLVPPGNSTYPIEFQSLGTPVRYRRGETVFRQGEKEPNIYLIGRGLLKGVYTTADGKEFIKTLIGEGDFIGSLTAQAPDGLCSFSLICLEDVEALRVPFALLEKRAETDLDYANILRRALQALALKKERREFELLCLSPEERYRLVFQRTPDLLARATQNDIARYIGITPVALSRIRSRLRSFVRADDHMHR